MSKFKQKSVRSTRSNQDVVLQQEKKSLQQKIVDLKVDKVEPKIKKILTPEQNKLELRRLQRQINNQEAMELMNQQQISQKNLVKPNLIKKNSDEDTKIRKKIKKLSKVDKINQLNQIEIERQKMIAFIQQQSLKQKENKMKDIIKKRIIYNKINTQIEVPKDLFTSSKEPEENLESTLMMQYEDILQAQNQQNLEQKQLFQQAQKPSYVKFQLFENQFLNQNIKSQNLIMIKNLINYQVQQKNAYQILSPDFQLTFHHIKNNN